jgi:hypothetical protein
MRRPSPANEWGFPRAAGKLEGAQEPVPQPEKRMRMHRYMGTTAWCGRPRCGTSPRHSAICVLFKASFPAKQEDEEPLVREQLEWALGGVASALFLRTLLRRISLDTSPASFRPVRRGPE